MTGETKYGNYGSSVFLWWIVLALVVLPAGCGNEDQAHKDHQVEADAGKPDSMPGMDMSSHTHEQAGTVSPSNQMPALDKDERIQDEAYWLSLPPNQTVISWQQVVSPRIADTVFPITANGYISFDARRNHKLAVRVGGRIERSYVKYNYQYVFKGQKILELYSPELSTYIEEYLYVSRNTADPILKKRAKEKLLLLGLSPAQLNQIEKTGQVPSSIRVYSAVEGYVLFNPSGLNAAMESQANPTERMGMGTGAGLSSSIQASALPDNSIREGMYVSKDQTIFWINDFKVALGVLAFNKENEKYVKKGQVAVIQSELFPNQSFRSAIQFTEPVYQQGQKFTQARIYIPNSKGQLKLNSLITANIYLATRGMMLPSTSVMYLGRVAIVWVKTGTTKEGRTVFQSRVVGTGRKNANEVEILGGLKPGEAVARDASFLADSESIINY